MAREIRHYTVTIPAGTSAASPVTTALVMPARVVRAIHWRVPPGPRGVMGFRIGASGVQVIPWNTGEWIVADDESDELELQDQITSGGWQVFGYNLGSFDHSVYLTFRLDPPQRVGLASSTPAIIPADQLGGSSSGSDTGGAADGSDMDTGEGDSGDDGGSVGGDDQAGDGSGSAGGSGSGDGGVVTPGYAAGYAAAKRNALAALGSALGITGAPTAVARPAAGSDAATGYDDGKAAALARLGQLTAAADGGVLGELSGYAIARTRALAAVYGALGESYAGNVPAAPDAGTPARSGYDDGKAAALAALAGV